MPELVRLVSLGAPLLLRACDVQLRDASSAPRSHGTLSSDTNDPADPHRQTRVEFSPK